MPAVNPDTGSQALNDSVVRLIDRAPGFAVDGHSEMIGWLESWLAGFKQGDYGKFRSLVLVIEADDGTLATISQSLATMDSIRVAGLLMAASHRKLDGHAAIEELEQQA